AFDELGELPAVRARRRVDDQIFGVARQRTEAGLESLDAGDRVVARRPLREPCERRGLGVVVRERGFVAFGRAVRGEAGRDRALSAAPLRVDDQNASHTSTPERSLPDLPLARGRRNAHNLAMLMTKVQQAG